MKSSSSEQAPTSEFKKDDEEDKKEKENPSENKDDKKDEDNGGSSSDKEEDSADDKEKKDDEDKKKKFTVLEQEYKELQSSYASLKEEVEELLIERFYMLSDEDKKDVIEHKSEYSLEEIESKLALIGYRKGVNFNLNTSSENEESTVEEDESPVVTFDVKATEDSTVPEWVRAVESAMNDKY